MEGERRPERFRSGRPLAWKCSERGQWLRSRWQRFPASGRVGTRKFMTAKAAKFTPYPVRLTARWCAKISGKPQGKNLAVRPVPRVYGASPPPECEIRSDPLSLAPGVRCALERQPGDLPPHAPRSHRRPAHRAIGSRSHSSKKSSSSFFTMTCRSSRTPTSCAMSSSASSSPSINTICLPRIVRT